MDSDSANSLPNAYYTGNPAAPHIPPPAHHTTIIRPDTPTSGIFISGAPRRDMDTDRYDQSAYRDAFRSQIRRQDDPRADIRHPFYDSDGSSDLVPRAIDSTPATSAPTGILGRVQSLFRRVAGSTTTTDRVPVPAADFELFRVMHGHGSPVEVPYVLSANPEPETEAIAQRRRYNRRRDRYLPKAKQMHVSGLSAEQRDRTCSTCLDAFKDANGMVYETPCNHLFHADCLNPWIHQHQHRTCPLCRGAFRI
jgi:hypothetical protein